MKTGVFKVPPSDVEVALKDVMLAVSSLHVSSLVVVRSTSNKRDELLLPTSLL